MSTKSKTAMEESELQGGGRPVRAKKPVSYKEQPDRKRGEAVKESTEPADKKKKKANGNANGDAPPKKAGKKKTQTDNGNGNGKTSDKEETEENESMPEPSSRKRKNDANPAAEKAAPKTSKSRPKKAEEPVDVIEEAPIIDVADDDTDDKKVSESKPKQAKANSRKKPKGTTEDTNGDEVQVPSKATESKAKVPKGGKKATTKPVPVATEEAGDDGDDQDEVTTKEATSKPVTSKTTKGKKGAKESKESSSSNDAVGDEVAIEKKKPGRQPKKVASKATELNDD